MRIAPAKKPLKNCLARHREPEAQRKNLVVILSEERSGTFLVDILSEERSRTFLVVILSEKRSRTF
ncbi:MAG: hypothetical protein WCC87_20890 [Candidatus Korobacteraceae bacterium]